MFGRLSTEVRMGTWPAMHSFDVAGGISAAGSTQATATPINADVNVITTAAASTGVILPAPQGVGDTIVVTNRGANAVNVFPHVGGNIAHLAANTALSLAVNGRAVYVAVSLNEWLPIVSA